MIPERCHAVCPICNAIIWVETDRRSRIVRVISFLKKEQEGRCRGACKND